MQNKKNRVLLTYFIVGLLIHFSIYMFGGMSFVFKGLIYAQLDSIYPLNNYANLSLFANNNNLSLNLPSYYIHSLDRIFFTLMSGIGLNKLNINIIHTILIISLFYTTSFIIFQKYFKRLNNYETQILLTYFTFSPYILIFTDGGSFYTISTILAIAVFPIFVKTILEYKEEDFNLFVSISFIIFSSIIFIGPLLLLLFIMFFYNYKNMYIGCKNINLTYLTIILIPILFFAYLYLNLVDIDNIAEYNSSGMSGAIRGHIFYPLMQIHSWAYYTYWEPRVVANFSNAFFNPSYKVISLSIACIVIYVLVKNKKYKALLLLAAGVLFAKGESGLLSSLYTVTRDSPFGFLIRTPDTKFGILILSIYVYVVATSQEKLKKILLSLLLIFTVYNVSNMYLKGGISPLASNPSINAFYKYDNYEKVVDLINNDKYDNHLVITNSNLCESKEINNQYYACSDIILKNSNKQVVNTDTQDNNELNQTIYKYKKFPVVLVINKTLSKPRYPTKNFIESEGFKQLFTDDFYDIYVKGIPNNCINKYKFGCYFENNLEISSANKKFLQFNQFNVLGNYDNFFIIEKNRNNNYLIELFNIFLIISYILCTAYILLRKTSN